MQKLLNNTVINKIIMDYLRHDYEENALLTNVNVPKE